MKNEKGNKHVVTYLLIVVGVMLIILGITWKYIFNNENSSNDSENDSKEALIIDLKNIYQETIDVDVPEYNINEYSYGIVNGINQIDNKTVKYTFSMPQDAVIDLIYRDTLVYSKDAMKITTDWEIIDDFDSKITDTYNKYKELGYSVTLSSGEYNSMKILLLKLKNNSDYKEILLIFSDNANEFSGYYNYFQYEIDNYRFSSKFINDIIRNLKKEMVDEQENNCNLEEGKVICDYGIKKIIYNIDTNKYEVRQKSSLNNNYSSFNVDKESKTLLQISLYYNRNDIKSYMESNYIYNTEFVEKTINSKTIIQYESDNYYNNILYLDNNYALTFDILYDKPIDNILGDFLNFQVD